MPNYVGLTPKKTLNQFTSRLKHYYTGVVGLHQIYVNQVHTLIQAHTVSMVRPHFSLVVYGFFKQFPWQKRAFLIHSVLFNKTESGQARKKGQSKSCGGQHSSLVGLLAGFCTNVHTSCRPYMYTRPAPFQLSRCSFRGNVGTCIRLSEAPGIVR